MANSLDDELGALVKRVEESAKERAKSKKMLGQIRERLKKGERSDSPLIDFSILYFNTLYHAGIAGVDKKLSSANNSLVLTAKEDRERIKFRDPGIIAPYDLPHVPENDYAVVKHYNACVMKGGHKWDVDSGNLIILAEAHAELKPHGIWMPVSGEINIGFMDLLFLKTGTLEEIIPSMSRGTSFWVYTGNEAESQFARDERLQFHAKDVYEMIGYPAKVKRTHYKKHPFRSD